jgi:hypothetical protein
MPVVSQKISNLIGGVSQQPDSLKLPGQLRECDNYLPDPSFGLLKRPGSAGIGTLANATQDGSYFSMFLDQENRFIVQIAKNGTVRIWDADSGVQQTVNAQSSSALTYATHIDKSQLELLQINDFVFVVNRAVRVLEDAAKSPVITPTAFVLINTVSYDSTYTVIVDSTTFTYNSPSGSGGSGPLALSAVREAIRALIDANPTYVATAVGNAIKVRRADNGSFSINASGGDSGAAIEAYAGVVPSPAQLPREYFNGDKVQVNVPGSGTTGYWLQFNVTNAAASGAGVWVETIAPDTALRVTSTTMPHVLIKEANGTFTFREFSSTLAASTPQSASVTGTVATVTVTDPGLAAYAVGQTFSVSGGTGINLRLRVTGTTTNVTTTTSTLPGTTKVRWLVFSNRVEYNWIVNGTIIAVAPNDSSITVGDTVYSVGGAYVPDPGTLPPGVIQAFDAPITEVTTKTGVITSVEPSRIGRGYTASDVVADRNGATFTVGTVQTVTQEVIPFAKQFWTDRNVGDLTSNSNPSFVGATVTGMSFFQNRLIVMSGEDVVCSKAGDFFNFFNDSAAQFVESDPVDISCGSRTPVQLRFAISTNQGLYLFSDNAQYVLGTNTDAFSAASAEINQISNYPQSFRVGPVDTGSTFIFAEENDRSTMLFEIAPGDARQGRVEAAEITRLVPTYIPAGLIDLQISQSLSVVAARSARTPNTVYMFRFFNRGNERVMASWFKWTMPTEVKAIFFYQETLFVVMRCPAGCNTIVSKMSLLSDGPSGAIRFLDKAYDVKLDLFDYLPAVTYDAVDDESTIRFKAGFYVNGSQPVVVSLDPFGPGNVEEPSIDQDGFGFLVKVPGDRTSSRLALGLKCRATALLPSFYLRQGESGQTDTANIPSINRVQIDSFESGPFKVLVNSVGRQSFELEFPQLVANISTANTIPMLRTGKNVFPVMSRGDLTEVSFIANSPFPTALNSLVWEGTYNTKGVRVL